MQLNTLRRRKGQPGHAYLRGTEASCSKIDCVGDFYRWFSARAPFPSRSAFFGRGVRNSLGITVELEICINLPDAYRQTLKNSAGGIQSPLLEQWFKDGGRPLFFDVTETSLVLPERWLRNFIAFGYSNVLIHGVLQDCKGMMSVFGLYNLPACSESKDRLLLDNFARDIHDALLQVPVSRNDQRVSLPALPFGKDDHLTPREREVIDWLRLGKTNPEIAIILGISRHTVRNHLYNAMQKLSANNRTEVAMRSTHLS